jgi:4-aminobutyrate aminotransferase/(S)-3-amino-2-methylpropionate transaminase
MREEGLIERAGQIGEKIMNRLKHLQEQVPYVGDVRGLGAMCAMELVKDPRTKEPDKELTAAIIQECHQNGLVVMSAGIYSNVIRLLCPLVITDEQLNEGLDVLEYVVKKLTKDR